MKVTWLKKESTRVRMEDGGEKVEVNEGDVLDVSEEVGNRLLKYSRDFQPVTSDVKADHVQKAAPAPKAKAKAAPAPKAKEGEEEQK